MVTLALTAGLGVPAGALAQTVTIANVADTSSPEFSGFITQPSVNDSGTVAFFGRRDAGGAGVYTAASADTGFTPVALSSSAGFGSLTIASPGINNSGSVVFFGERRVDGGGTVWGIFTVAPDGGVTDVALNLTPDLQSVNVPSVLNDSGTTAFFGSRPRQGPGIFKAASVGTGSTQVAASVPSPEFAGFAQSAQAINNLGTVAFIAQRQPEAGGGVGIYKASSLATGFTPVVLSSARGWLDAFVGGPSINDSGTVAFILKGGDGGMGVYTATSAATGLNTVAVTADPESEFFASASINNLGTVAVAGDLGARGRGVFVFLEALAGPVPVVRVGDELFGSTVTDLEFGQGLARGSDTVAFQYTLANGVSGIARASISAAATAVPEPGSIALILAGLVGTGLARRRRPSSVADSNSQ